MSKYIFYKDSSLERPRNVSQADYNTASFGTILPFEPSDNKFNIYYFSSSAEISGSDHDKIRSLKNLINRHSALDDYYNFDSLFNNTSSLMTLNSYYLGSGIERGTVRLTTYKNGTALDTITDSKQNGVLESETYGKVGVVFYKEGIFLFGNSTAIDGNTANFDFGVDNPRWTNYFCSDTATGSMYHDIEYNYIESVPTAIFYAVAGKYDLNHSNNRTFLQSGSYSATSGSTFFKENDKIAIKNVVQSPFTSGSAQFEKETYITRIGLYDKNNKLIGVTSLANPVRKTENREFVFKIKLDI
jgi:hypothetical protein